MKLIILLMVVVLCDQVHERNMVYNLGECHYRRESSHYYGIYELQCKSSEFNCACENYHVFLPNLSPPPECIPQQWVCDAYEDCGDGKDELDCVCSPGMFQCNRCKHNEPRCIAIYQCIPYNKVCDGRDDCANRRDEYGGQCQREGFRCDDGYYILSRLTCNFAKDCRDGSDERGCYNHACDSNKMTNNTCVHGECYIEKEKCDGRADCNNHSDEMNCSTSCRRYGTIRCACNQVDNYTCTGSGYVCYSKDEKCDGSVDCNDHSDEMNCSTTCRNVRRPIPCACNQVDNYTCTESKRICYSKDEKCDGFPHCNDHSDEMNCSTSCRLAFYGSKRCSCNQANNYTCTGSGGICYDEHGKCDGRVQCNDHSDEINCSTSCRRYGSIRCACNQVDNYTCTGNGDICYRKDEKCDGSADCNDHSDEMDCSTPCQTFRLPIPCACNQVGNYTCTGNGDICHSKYGKCNGFVGCNDRSDEMNCSPTCPSFRQPLPCACNQANNNTCTGSGQMCYSKDEKCDGFRDCNDHSDEMNCSISCLTYGTIRCACNQVDNYTCTGYGLVCYDEDEKCDGYRNCKDHSDEMNCSTSCRRYGSIRCACNQVDSYTCTGYGRVCYDEDERCDASSQCLDTSDESNCACPDDLFTCTCFRKNKPTCNMKKGCIRKQLVHDGKFDCNSGNDEGVIIFNKVECSRCIINILRFKYETLCLSPWCDNTTCYSVPALECSTNKCNHTDVICTSSCIEYNTTNDCNTVMQCEDQTNILNRNFCDGRRDCDDNSDETTNRPGFKCSAKFSPITCVLPQWNLYDNIAQCHDRSDICFDKDKNLLCFECLDRRLIISSLQVCDNVIDCYDLSDECLCENTTLSICLDRFSHTDAVNLECDTKLSICEYKNTTVTIDSVCDGITQCNNSMDEANCNKNISTIKCQSKWGEIEAVQCDGRPECNDFKDECNSICNNPPIFCNDTCHSFYPLGDRYCDGYIDQAWIYLKNTNCPSGFDELNCPMRFECRAGKKVSIDVLQKCNGILDCDDGSDEKNCPDRIYCNAKAGGLVSLSMDVYLDGKQDCIDGSDEFEIGLFSSPKEMIANVGLRVWFWIVAIITLLGNVYVICMSLKHLMDKKLGNMSRCNHLLALNLSASDFLMGVYLLIILVKARHYSGNYSMYDREWRTSSICSLAGSLCVISSQTSIFMMSILTAHRLFNILWPFKARAASTTPWKSVMFFAWLISILLAILSNVLDYFKHAVIFPNRFFASDLVTDDDVISFACRLASLTNTSIIASEDGLQSAINYLTKEFPFYSPQGDIGYYGTTSMCIPRYYVTTNNRYWIYSIGIITLNFISFSFVVISYVFIWKQMSNRPTNSKQAQKEEKSFQNRVTRLIVTDFCCWIPICVMAYLSIAGVKIPGVVDFFTAGVLLPINSALNPILYSKHIEDLFSKLVKRMQRKKEVENRNVVELQNIS